MSVNFKQLQSVIEIAKWGSFNKASSLLNISQSTLSQYITKLESEFNIKIFERTTRTVVLTKRGQEFVADASAIVDLVTTFEEKYGESSKQMKIRLGLVPSIGYWKLSELVNTLGVELSFIEFSVLEKSAKELEQLLLNRQLDIILTDGIFDESAAITHQILVADDMRLILSKSHRFASIEHAIKLQDLRNESFIFAGPETGIHSMLQSAFEAEDFIPKTVVQCSSVPLVSKMVASGIGVAFFSRNLITGGLADDISAIDITPPIKKPLFLSYLTRLSCMEELVIFIRHAESWVENHLPNSVPKR
jgi:DNA-binding transcriptional LysR family regulator